MDQPTLFNKPSRFPHPAVIRAALADEPGKARADHGHTSKEAARRIDPATGRLKALVFQAVLKAGGLTDEEGIAATEMSPSTYRPRRVELVESGVLRDSGRTRPTLSGRSAVVWEVVPK